MQSSLVTCSEGSILCVHPPLSFSKFRFKAASFAGLCHPPCADNSIPSKDRSSTSPNNPQSKRFLRTFIAPAANKAAPHADLLWTDSPYRLCQKPRSLVELEYPIQFVAAVFQPWQPSSAQTEKANDQQGYQVFRQSTKKTIKTQENTRQELLAFRIVTARLRGLCGK